MAVEGVSGKMLKHNNVNVNDRTFYILGGIKKKSTENLLSREDRE